MRTLTIQQSFDLAVQHHQAGRLNEAEQLYRQILARQPAHVDAMQNLGLLAHQQARNDVAVDLIRRAIALKPNWPEAYSNLGLSLKESGQLDEAIASYRKALALKSDAPGIFYNLGVALQSKRQLDEAIAAYRQAIVLKPDHASAHNDLGETLKDKGQLDEAIVALRKAIALKPKYAKAHSNLIHLLYYHPDFDAAAIAQECRLWNRQYAEPLRQARGMPAQPHPNDPNPDRRLRVGYISPDLREHAVGWFLLPLLANHDRQCVEVFAYAQVRVPDGMTRKLHSHTDAWRNLVGLSDAQTADLIRQDRIDILVDLTLHTGNNSLLVFAREPAPVQVTYLAYAGTSGLNTMDYRLSDPYLDPPGEDESIYSEQTVRLPQTYWCYQPVVDLPVQPPPAITNGFITFGSLNNFCKINPPLLSLWAQVLRAVPRSHLLLHAHEGSHRQRVLDQLQREGVEPERVSFARMASVPSYFRQYHSIDIALDTVPYGGGTTTCDALWMGVPVVSLMGKTAVGRGGFSILSNVGLAELVANTPEEYVQIAVELANDPSRLQALRLTLRQRMQRSPLMDAPRFARNIEAAYRQMWQTWCKAASVGNSA